jgi:hypothetical protein
MSVGTSKKSKLLIGRQSVGPNNAFLRGLYIYEKEKQQITTIAQEFRLECFHSLKSVKLERLFEGTIFERVGVKSTKTCVWFLRLKKDMEQIEYKELTEQQQLDFNIKAPMQCPDFSKFTEKFHKHNVILSFSPC